MENNNKISFKKIVIIVLIAILFHWMINNFSIVGNIVSTIVGILSPFILGGVLAFIINIPMAFFERKLFGSKNKNNSKIKNKVKGNEVVKVNKGARTISLILAIITIVFILSLIVKLIVPELINVINLLIENIPYYVSELVTILKDHSNDINIEELTKDLNVNLKEIKNQLINKVPTLLSSSVSIIGGILGGITTFIIAVVFAIYILTDKENIGTGLKNLLYAYVKKEKVDKILNIGTVSSNTFKNYKKYFFSIHNSSMFRSNYFRRIMCNWYGIFKNTICNTCRSISRSNCINTCCRCIYRMYNRCNINCSCKSSKSSDIYNILLNSATS